MQDNPSKDDLLRAVSRFLKEELRPALDNKGLQFRALTASNLIRMVADELAVESDADQTELNGLLKLFPEASYSSELNPEQRCAAILELREALAKQIRRGDIEDRDEVFRFLKENLASKLAVVSPRFSTELEIE